MKTRVAINGLGRIGRSTLKIILDRDDMELVAVNDLADPAFLAHLIMFDSVYGVYDKQVSIKDTTMHIDDMQVAMFAERDPEKLPWKELNVDLVIESTGFFIDYEGSKKHLTAGAKAVIISANTKDSDKINSYVLQVNTEKFDPEKDVITSMGSCTTNCLAPVAKVLNDEFGIKKGLLTTTHSYTSSQSLVDGPNDDIRRARAANLSQIPATTGAAKAIHEVLPELKGKIDGRAIRVPTPTVSLVDLVCDLEKSVTVDDINNAFISAANGNLSGVLAAESRELVSNDFKQNPHGSIVDLPLTMVIGDTMAKVYSWYDNEWGYCYRLAEYSGFVAEQLELGK
jgi:glyceraldehyde 3-phosphate dehydrogenase